ncbi:hypothetical protein EK21DRAFT_95789 [Setomelanomma holmii]|uniref:Dienelactone hydrolase domain-containing protein n=1 Tax=Setomelanomma holmii TaxID=210430 RepID=A0A9P4HJP3_9PLEO|nr:hypothetical protein EK21DRAFT_95789 [Setomelanomma holmii]
MASPAIVHFPSFMLQICGELYAPASSSPGRVKEQTSATYARALSKPGFQVLTFDADYRGESTGEPRGTLTLPASGVLGICASGGYTSYAVQSDSRIHALATASAAYVGRMTRCGAIAGALNQAPGGAAHVPTDKSKIPERADSFFRDAAAYYGTARGRHERSDQKVPPMSYGLMVSHDSFRFQHLIVPKPLLMIAGSNAQTLHYSKTAVALASEPKEFFTIQRKNHSELYDDVTETAPKLIKFFGHCLQ